MHFFRVRLILALIASVTLVSLASTYFDVLAHRHSLREDLERRSRELWHHEGHLRRRRAIGHEAVGRPDLGPGHRVARWDVERGGHHALRERGRLPARAPLELPVPSVDLVALRPKIGATWHHRKWSRGVPQSKPACVDGACCGGSRL